MDKPKPNDKVWTRERRDNIGGEDTGIISYLSDGGYCGVKWDSDGSTTEVPMRSLRPKERK